MKEKLLYCPDKVSAPGITLFHLLEERRMTLKTLYEQSGIPLKTINEIIHGRATITPEVSIKLEMALGISANFWNQRQANYYTSGLANNERVKT